MNKEQLEEKAIQYALGTLPREEATGFESIIKSDRELQRMVHDYQLINELDADEVAQKEPPFELYAQIMSRIEEEERKTKGVLKAIEERKVVPMWTWMGWAVAACAGVMVGISAWSSRTNELLDNHNDIMLSDLGQPGSARFVVSQDDADLEMRMVELADLAEAYWFSRMGLPPEESEAVAESTTEGFTIFDSKYKIGFIGVENLPLDKRGKAYHVWAKAQTGGPPIRAGMLRGGENSRGLFFFDLSQSGELDDFAGGVSFFVTEETEELPATPSDQIVLSGI